MKALCFGSLNIDYTYRVPHFVGKGETLSSTQMQTFSGGKGLNQAIAMAKAGLSTSMAGAMGRDGMFLKAQLESAGVDTALVHVFDDIRTGHAIIQNDPTGDNCILLYGGANQAITEEMADEVLAHFNAGDIILLQNEISSLPHIIEKANEKGLRVVLNPSPMDEKILACPLDKVSIFILNEVEASQLTGCPAEDADALALGLSRRFPESEIVLTLGGDGSMFISSGKTLRQSAYNVKAVDTTAAGDTFTGFFLRCYVEGMSPETALDIASRAAAIAVTKPGASPSIPTMEEVENYKF